MSAVVPASGASRPSLLNEVAVLLESGQTRGKVALENWG